MRIPIALRRLPILVAMALLVLPWAVPAANGLAARLRPGTVLIREPTLFGVEPATPRPTLSVAGLWSGAFQRAAARSFDQSLPLLATAVGVKNQVYFSLLNQSGIPGVVVGRRLQLYEPAYIEEYCSRDTGRIMQAAEARAAELAAIQRWYADRGRVFVYVITPSKAATYPQYLPPAVSCWSPPALRDALLPEWGAVLDRHGVRHVDAATLVRRAARDYPFEMFPRGGTHWNDVAAALAAQAVVRAVDAAPTPWKLPEFRFTWQLGPPVDVARDLTDLLNLPRPRLDYGAPQVAVVPDQPPPPECRRLHLGVVGGSFTYEILWTLMRLPCAPVIDFYTYFGITHAHYPGDVRHDVDPAQRDPVLLRDAQVVMLEENEQLALRSQHAPALGALLRGQGQGAALDPLGPQASAPDHLK